jgi:porphobilinogen deaminase
MRAGCLAPLGALCTEADGRLELTAVVLDPQGKRRIDYVACGSIDDPEALGASAAEALLAAGGAELIASARFVNPAG